MEAGLTCCISRRSEVWDFWIVFVVAWIFCPAYSNLFFVSEFTLINHHASEKIVSVN